MTLHNVIILIKSVLNKGENHYYYNIYLEILASISLKKSQKIFHSTIMLRFGETKATEQKFYATKKLIKISDVNADNIVISKLIGTKTNPKYLIGYSGKAIKPICLLMPKMNGFVKTFEVKDGDKDEIHKWMSFRIDAEKLLEKYKAIWTKIEDLKILN